MEHRRARVCEDLRSARLRTGDGSHSLRLVECDSTAFGAVVHWQGVETTFDYRGIIRFDWTKTNERLIPVELAAYQREWPCLDDCAATDGQIELSSSHPCEEDHAIIPVALELKAKNSLGCVWIPWLTGTQKLWCEHPIDTNREVFRVWSWSLKTGIGALGPIVLDRDSVAVRLDGEWIVSRDPTFVAASRSSLSELWTARLDTEESCRDGGTLVVHARNRRGWRSVSRACSDPGGVLAVIRAVRAGAVLSTSPAGLD